MTSTSTTISENCTYIQNPSYPSVYSETSALTYTINKCSASVCAVRLDFETFATAGPSATTETSGGVCTDSFVVTGTSGLSTPVICGSNAGQHCKKNKIHILHFKLLDPCALNKLCHIWWWFILGRSNQKRQCIVLGWVIKSTFLASHFTTYYHLTSLNHHFLVMSSVGSEISNGN